MENGRSVCKKSRLRLSVRVKAIVPLILGLFPLHLFCIGFGLVRDFCNSSLGICNGYQSNSVEVLLVGTL